MDFNLQEYLAGGVEGILKDALRTSIRNPKESLFLVKFSKHARKATKIRQEYSRNGQNIPAFLIASVTSRCNLHCKGCYSRANDACSDDESIDQLSADEWDDIFAQAKELGISFIVLAGGEPMMRRDIIAKASEYPEILFPIFTNGTLLDDDYFKLLDENRNLVPVLSIEGDEEITDSRRGEGVYARLVNSMNMMRDNNIIFGASLTFTKGNLNTLLTNDYIDRLHESGCKVVFFIEYVPVDESTIGLGCPERKKGNSWWMKSIGCAGNMMTCCSCHFRVMKRLPGDVLRQAGDFSISTPKAEQNHVLLHHIPTSTYATHHFLKPWIHIYSNHCVTEASLWTIMREDAFCSSIRKMSKEY